MNRIFKITPWLIGFCFVATILQFVVFGILAVKVVDEVQDKGVKSIVENVWCGKQQDCKFELKEQNK